MRKLSPSFLQNLKTGFLSGIVRTVKDDHDLNLEIRDNYINLYYKGHSLLRISETRTLQYRVNVDRKFRDGLDLPTRLDNIDSVNQFIRTIPTLKQNIIKIGSHSLEIEYEQMIIRANNYEPKNASEYFIVDRQYVDHKLRFDLTGFYWPSRGRRKNQEVAMCLMEVKFGLNTDIADVHTQLDRYYEAIKPKAASIAGEGETILKQKLAIGLYDQSPERLTAMETLSFAKDISAFQFVLILVDFNPFSKILNIENLKKLSFADQIRIFSGGFAMWQQNAEVLFDDI
jgi:hypothetical protein